MRGLRAVEQRATEVWTSESELLVRGALEYFALAGGEGRRDAVLAVADRKWGTITLVREAADALAAMLAPDEGVAALQTLMRRSPPGRVADDLEMMLARVGGWLKLHAPH